VAASANAPVASVVALVVPRAIVAPAMGSPVTVPTMRPVMVDPGVGAGDGCGVSDEGLAGEEPLHATVKAARNRRLIPSVLFRLLIIGTRHVL
jgi:hypothetical protein